MLTLGDALEAEAAPARLRRLVRALRLYDAGAVGLAPVAWVRLDDGPWQLVDLARRLAGAARASRSTMRDDQEDELRAFVALAARRMPRGGELAWALRRFDLACERPSAAEALTDLLLALRALLEPEGPESGLLRPRLAALCAADDERDELAERVADAVALERAHGRRPDAARRGPRRARRRADRAPARPARRRAVRAPGPRPAPPPADARMGESAPA